MCSIRVLPVPTTHSPDRILRMIVLDVLPETTVRKAASQSSNVLRDITALRIRDPRFLVLREHSRLKPAKARARLALPGSTAPKELRHLSVALPATLVLPELNPPASIRVLRDPHLLADHRLVPSARRGHTVRFLEPRVRYRARQVITVRRTQRPPSSVRREHSVPEERRLAPPVSMVLNVKTVKLSAHAPSVTIAAENIRFRNRAHWDPF